MSCALPSHVLTLTAKTHTPHWKGKSRSAALTRPLSHASAAPQRCVNVCLGRHTLCPCAHTERHKQACHPTIPDLRTAPPTTPSTPCVPSLQYSALQLPSGIPEAPPGQNRQNRHHHHRSTVWGAAGNTTATPSALGLRLGHWQPHLHLKAPRHRLLGAPPTFDITRLNTTTTHHITHTHRHLTGQATHSGLIHQALPTTSSPLQRSPLCPPPPASLMRRETLAQSPPPPCQRGQTIDAPPHTSVQLYLPCLSKQCRNPVQHRRMQPRHSAAAAATAAAVDASGNRRWPVRQ